MMRYTHSHLMAESKTVIKTIMGVTFTFIHWRLSESHG